MAICEHDDHLGHVTNDQDHLFRSPYSLTKETLKWLSGFFETVNGDSRDARPGLSILKARHVIFTAQMQ